MLYQGARALILSRMRPAESHRRLLRPCGDIQMVRGAGVFLFTFTAIVADGIQIQQTEPDFKFPFITDQGLTLRGFFLLHTIIITSNYT